VVNDVINTLDISVVVPVHNGGRPFRRCLGALVSTDPPPGEVIVVVDGDAGHSATVARAFDVRLLHTPMRGGPARARNLGARAAHGAVLLFVDADVLVPPDTIHRVAAVFREDPGLAAVFGSYDDSPAAPSFLSQYKNLLHHYVHQRGNEEASTFWAGCGAIRRDVFLATGGFDVSYDRPAVEDIELGYRLTQAGHRIRLCKTLQVKHLKQWTALSLLRADIFHRALPWTRLILHHRRFDNDLNLHYGSRISAVLTFLMTCALMGSWRWPEALIIAGTAALALLLLNASVYRFLLRQRGLWFVLRAMPWHWFYYLYSGLAFAWGAVTYWLKGNASTSDR
jgi:GT2 family glycosyltransferase